MQPGLQAKTGNNNIRLHAWCSIVYCMMLAVHTSFATNTLWGTPALIHQDDGSPVSPMADDSAHALVDSL